MAVKNITVNLLNKFIGDYVENVDKSQLKINILGGNVVLENLILKQSALNSLDLPVQTIFGSLAKLVLTVDWANLSSGQIEASIEGLYLLVIPNQQVKYETEKEDRILLLSKKKTLQKVEEGKQKNIDKGEVKGNNSYTEQLTTALVKNMLLKIKDIHIRYEDNTTHQGSPFSLGFNLYNLSVHTILQKPVVPQVTEQIHKMLTLEGLVIYWNSDSILYTNSASDRSEMLEKFQEENSSKVDNRIKYKRILGPINATAELALNPKPEKDQPKFSIPKVVFKVKMEELSLQITKQQYQDIMMLANSMDIMISRRPFRKFRPFLFTYKSHYKEWWKYAYTCVVEREVKRSKSNWNWKYISRHRSMCKSYAVAYQTKLQTSNKVSLEVSSVLDECELNLDIFNLVFIRQRIEKEVQRLGSIKKEADKKKGWFSSWFGGGKDKQSDQNDILEQFKNALTNEDISKFYEAIDYHENIAPTVLPVEFVATEFHFSLNCLLLHVSDDTTDVLTSRLSDVRASFKQRPTANGLRVDICMNNFTVTGVKHLKVAPHLVTSRQITPHTSLLTVMFESNPLDGECGKRIKVSAQPLQLLYDAQTILKIVEVFKIPAKSFALAQLRQATKNKLSDLKEKFSVDFLNALSQRTVYDIDVEILSSYLILPHSGRYNRNTSCAVVNFGAINVKSIPRSKDALNIPNQLRNNACDDELLRQAKKHSYDKFFFELTEIQVIVAKEGEDWESSILSRSTPLHLLQPTCLSVEIEKCLITDDPRLPKIKLNGQLPFLNINVSEGRLIKLIRVLESLRFPENEEVDSPPQRTAHRSSSLSILKYFDPVENNRRQNERRLAAELIDNFVQITEFEATFIMHEFNVVMLRTTVGNPIPLISFALKDLKLSAVQRTLSLEASAQLGGADIILHPSPTAVALHLLSTARAMEDQKQYLFTIKYQNVNKHSPDFSSQHGSVEQLIELDFTFLQLLLHQEGIQQLITIAEQVKLRLREVQGAKDRVGTARTPLSNIQEGEEMSSHRTVSKSPSSFKYRRESQEMTGLKVTMVMEHVGVEIATQQRSLARMSVKGLTGEIIMKNSKTSVQVNLQDIQVIDHNPASIHKQIVSVVKGNALTLGLVMYNMRHFENTDRNDMAIEANISRLRMVFLNQFVSSMTKFLGNFQTAVQAIKQAWDKALDTVKDNLQTAYKSSVRVALNIKFETPIIIIPQNSKSYEAVLADLGFITVKTKFKKKFSAENRAYIVQELILDLDKLNLSRIIFVSNAYQIRSEKILLEPTTFTLTVTRNLSSSWYAAIPDIHVDGKLGAITLILANPDFKMLMSVLSENLAVGREQNVKTTRPMQSPDSISTRAAKRDSLRVRERAMYRDRRGQPAKPPHIVVKFSLTMDRLTIEIMTKVSSGPQVHPDSSSEIGLAKLSLLLLTIKGNVNSDRSITTNLELKNCELDDTRPNRETKITHFMGRSTNVSVSRNCRDTRENMIVLAYTKDGFDSNMNWQIFNFNLILSMEFLMKIGDFVSSGLSAYSIPQPYAHPIPDKASLRGQSSPSRGPPQATTQFRVPEYINIPTAASILRRAERVAKGKTIITLKVEKPNIILVESMEGRQECQAIVLNSEVFFKMRIREDERVIDCSIDQIQLFTSSFGRSGERPANRVSVLEPCAASLTASTSANKGWIAKISFIDSYNLKVSPATINLLNRVLVTMSKPDAAPDASTIESNLDVLGKLKTLQKYMYSIFKRGTTSLTNEESVSETNILMVSMLMSQIEVEISTDERPLALLTLAGLRANLIMTYSGIQVMANLRDVQIVDLNPASLHKQILSIVDGDAFRVQLIMHNMDLRKNADRINDMELSTIISRIKIVFLNQFISSLLNFLHNYKAAVEAIKRVLLEAVKWSKVNFMSTYEHATKITVGVNLKAPMILIPQNSQSYNAVLVDLGEAILTTKFVKLKVDETNGVIVQELMLDLDKFKLSQVILTSNAYEVGSEKIFLQPTFLRLCIKWNLSSAWYPNLPKIQFNGRMRAIRLKVANSDIKNMMQILRENLSEERNPRVEASPPPLRLGLNSSNISSQVRSATVMDTANMMIGTMVEDSTPNRISMKFIIESLAVELMTEVSASLQTQFSDGPPAEVGLARFSLLQLSIEGNTYPNESVEISLRLKDCQLDDTRPNRESKITRFMERKTQEDPTALIDVSTEGLSMIEAFYTRKPLQTRIDLQVFNFNLILSIEFLLKIGNFLTNGLSTFRLPAQPEGRYRQNVQSVHSRVDQASNESGVGRYIPTAASLLGSAKRDSKGMMTINLKLKKPDIILVESMEGRESCQALVFNSKVNFKLSIKDDQKDIKGSIEELQLFACRFGRFGERSISRCSVLAPCLVSLKAFTSQQKGWNVDISFTDIAINISPATIYLLNRAMVTMATPDVDDLSNKNKNYCYQDLWNIKPFRKSTFWFLNPEKPEEAMYLDKFEVILRAHATPSTGEICILTAPVIVLTIETGRGTETMPMLNMQASLNGLIKDWNSQLNMECKWSMQASYYNKSQALWEPLLEPVEVLKGGLSEHIPWELKMHAQKNKKVAADKELSVQEPNLAVQITSSQPLELTITTTALQVMHSLHNSFTTAIKSKLYQRSIYSPYLLNNNTELTVWMMTDKGSFEMFTESIDGAALNNQNQVVNNLIMVNPGDRLPLKLRAGLGNSIGLNKHLPDWMLHVKVGGMNCELSLPVVRADNRFFHLQGALAPGQTDITGRNTLDGCALISQVSMVEGTMHISLHSVVQICNNFLVPVEVFYRLASHRPLVSLGYVQPKGVMNFPLKAVYYTTYEVFFSVEGYKSSLESYTWKNVRDQTHNTNSKLLECESQNPENHSKFYIKVLGSTVDAFVNYSNSYPVKTSKIRISPAMVLQNTLPVDINVSVLGVPNSVEQTVKPGDTLHLPLVEPGRTSIYVKLPSYLNEMWVCTHKIPDGAPEFDVWTFDSQKPEDSMVLDLGMHCAEVNGSQHYSLYCPFWMLNKTGLFLTYWTEEMRQNICHPCNYTGPILFSSIPKNFFGMKKAAVRVCGGDWSENFSLDIPKTSQVVSCKNAGFLYQIGVSNELTYNNLTKQVTFTPYITLINTAPFAIECQEPEAKDFVQIEAHSSAPFWPKSKQKEKLMRLKAGDKHGVSVLFEYTKQQSTLLQLNNEHGGVNVETLVTEGGVYVTLGQYRPGLAPALIINHTPYEVNLWQEDIDNILVVKGMHSVMFTWENPAGIRRLTLVGASDTIVENDLLIDGTGEFPLGDDDLFYWSSFLDGMQRVLLISPITIDSTQTGAIQKEVILSMHGIGLSLVNTAMRQEVMYISIASSGVIWETSKMTNRHYKALSITQNAMLEEAYQKFLAECEVAGKTVSRLVLLSDNESQVDFASWRMFVPEQVPIRRSLQPGLWAQYGRGRHGSQLTVRLHRLQADQQLLSPTFPVVLAPVPPPRRVASLQALKPFMELCIIQRLMKYTNVKQFKYCKLLVQEFHVKLDIQLLHALVGMLPEVDISESIAAERFALDMEAILRPLEAVVAEYTASDQKHFYDHLHLSPLKIHMSLLLGNILHMPSAAGTLLKAMGVKAVNMDDILFKLAYYERTYSFLSWKELFLSSKSHYRGQIFKQLYVLIFNPFGIATGLTKGLEDLFYEPFQGDVGVGDRAAGVMYGVRSVLGHTVGGAAGTASRISDALGHGFAALSLDSKFQNERREKMSKPPPANLQEGLARGGKDLLKGVFSGVTGVITKPISGAREEGALGFFKGLGKGAVGLVVRPATSVADVACGSFEFVKRTSDLTPEITRMRLARFFEVDGLVLPYSKFKAEGQELLRVLGKEKYNREVYMHHVLLSSPARDVVLCTSRRIIYLEKGKRMEWSFPWPHLRCSPTEQDNGAFISLKEHQAEGFSSGAKEKVIYIDGGPAIQKFVEQCTKCIQQYKH